jgi:hypothetical protein
MGSPQDLVGNTESGADENRALLSLALEMAKQESPPFYNHVVDLVRQAVWGEIDAAAFTNEDFRSDIDRLKEQMPKTVPVILPEDLRGAIIKPEYVELVFSEILHRGVWETTLERNRAATDALIDMISAQRGPA